MVWIIMALLFAIAFLYLLQEFLSSSRKKRRSLPPGPRGLPFIGHLHLLSKNPYLDLCRLAQKHGPVMGISLAFYPALVLSSPEAAKLILKTHDLVFASRPGHNYTKYERSWQRYLSVAPYGPYWRNMRKLCSLELLSNLRINQFQAMRKAELGMMVSSLKQAAEERDIVDLSARVSVLMGDMNCQMIFGTKYADRDLDDQNGFKALITEVLELTARLVIYGCFPYIGSLVLRGTKNRLRVVRKVFDQFLEKIIDDHVKNKEKKQSKDFVDRLMAIMESGEAGFEFDRRHIKAVLVDLLVAGMDTSATTVEWALSELIRHPDIMKKLQQELESVVGIHNMVEESHLDKLQYLDYVVKEVLRLHPVGPLLPHESMEDCVVDGFHIQKGSLALVNVWAIGRDPNLWPDPEKFLPERFIDSDIDLKGQHFQLLPFGSGRRSCPGLQLGLTLVRLVLAQLVHCFDWELPNDMNPAELDMSEHYCFVASRAKHLMAIPSNRHVNIEH